MRMSNLSCLSWSSSLWYTLPVMLQILMLPICIMESVQKTFLSPLEITPLSMRTHMLISGDETLARSIKSEVRKLITDGLFLIHHTGFESSGVISMWSVFSQSDASSTSTSMSIRAMITQLWSLADVKMKSSFIWIHAMFLDVKQYGDCFIFQCMKTCQMWLVSRSIFLNSR